MSKKTNMVCGVKVPPEIRPKIDKCKQCMDAVEKIAITYAVQRYIGLRSFGISPDYGSALERLKEEIIKAIDTLGDIMPSAQNSQIVDETDDD